MCSELAQRNSKVLLVLSKDHKVMKFVFRPSFVAVSTCSLDFFEALLQLVASPAPLSGLFFHTRPILTRCVVGCTRASQSHRKLCSWEVAHWPPSRRLNWLGYDYHLLLICREIKAKMGVGAWRCNTPAWRTLNKALLN